VGRRIQVLARSEVAIRKEKLTNMNTLMPVVFIGHGSPDNAFERNEFNTAWKKLAATIAKPRSILCISAHWTNSVNWQGSGTAVTAQEKPRTIHDFYGFPENYYKLKYPAQGAPELAKQISKMGKSVPIVPDKEWGLDHGAWSVLVNMYPKADVPTVQLSIDESLSLSKHVEIGRDLRELRKEGVLILGSGNIVHNLMALGAGEPFPWAVDFDSYIKKCLLKNDVDGLIQYERQDSASNALPTNEHYLPLLYAVGAADGGKPGFFNEKFFAASVSMRCVVFG
jgi:4,5-DOPA dioxygenase extradiol